MEKDKRKDCEILSDTKDLNKGISNILTEICENNQDKEGSALINESRISKIFFI